MDDYDITLVSLVNLLYLFLDDYDVLDDEAAYNILCQNGDGKGCESDDHKAEWDGMGGYLTFDVRNFFAAEIGPHEAGSKPRLYRVETENHVAMIHAWNYLASLWILVRGANSPLEKLESWRAEGLDWLGITENRDRFFDNVLQFLGRPLHSGFFETNARPYQELTLTAILTLALYGNPLEILPDQPDLDEDLRTRIEDVHQAAWNAFGYAVAMYSFQSLRSKRSAPFRRRRDYRNVVDFYTAERSAVLFGLLSGAYDYEDCMNTDYQYECRLMRFPNVEAQHKSLWAAMGRLNRRWKAQPGYELPEAIQGNMFDKRPYFAIMQAKYSAEQYPVSIVDLRYGATPPYYFEDGSPPEVFMGKSFRGSPEIYFGDGDLLLAAGGMMKELFPGDKTESEYMFRARPTMLFPRGDFGHADIPYFGITNDMEWKSFTHAASAHVLLMRGIRDTPWKSTCNTWVYKSLAYGYTYDYSVGTDFHDGWAQEYPAKWWDAYPHKELQIGHAQVRIVTLPSGALSAGIQPPVGEVSEGYYLVLIKPRKSDAQYATSPIFYNYRRGIVEVVPGYLFGSAGEAAEMIQEWNPPHYFSDVSEPDARDYPYRYVTMSSRERVTLDPGMGWAGWGEWEGCRNGVRSIETLVDPGSGPLGSDDDARWATVDREALYIPREIRDDGGRKSIPLVQVWELDQRYRRTGRMLMESPEPGRIIVRRRTMLDLSATGSVPGWQCLDLDSRDYRKPVAREYEVEQYGQCVPVSPSQGASFVSQVSAGGAHTCVVTLEGALYCWGSNDAGQLGLGSTASFATEPQPVVAPPGENIAHERVAAGLGHTCAITTAGKTRCWGNNTYGQLGVGDTISTNSPRMLDFFGDAGEPRVRGIVAGSYHSCALSGEGRVYCWGSNLFGQLGLGLGPAHVVSPHAVIIPERVVAVRAGSYHSCAVTETGGLYCWGLNSTGQLGDQTTTTRRAPVQVSFTDASDGQPVVEAVALGTMHTCAIVRMRKGTASYVSCFGSNAFNQLGVELPPGALFATSPTTVTALVDVDSRPIWIDAGGAHTCARCENGTVHCWGDNALGQLGDGNFGSTTAIAGVVLVSFPGGGTALGGAHTCLISQIDGSLHCFGSNGEGQLGRGSLPSQEANPIPEAVSFP
ncbi:MAG: hypothetical protein RBU30_00320 [Polyangia bacterium]|nr:hypothetical protein [Polyangia bacterium]